MKTNSVSQATIDLLKSFGFEVYMRSTNDSWLYFTNGKNLGYLQNNETSGYCLSTVHKPNQTTGTGFQIAKEITNLSKEALEMCFVIAPSWANYGDARTVIKYTDMADFIKASSL